MNLYIEGFQTGARRTKRPYIYIVASPVLEPESPARFIEAWSIGVYMGNDLVAALNRYWPAADRTLRRRYSFRIPRAPELLMAAVFAGAGIFLLLHG